MKALQKEAVAKQVKLDEESLQRLKEAEAKDKVSHCIHGGLHDKGALQLCNGYYGQRLPCKLDAEQGL